MASLSYYWVLIEIDTDNACIHHLMQDGRSPRLTLAVLSTSLTFSPQAAHSGREVRFQWPKHASTFRAVKWHLIRACESVNGFLCEQVSMPCKLLHDSWWSKYVMSFGRDAGLLALFAPFSVYCGNVVRNVALAEKRWVRWCVRTHLTRIVLYWTGQTNCPRELSF